MGFEGSISESAFLVNESRARNVAISRDRYAHLWVSDATRALWDEFAREVYPHDEIELGVRNRFFLERLAAAVDGGRIGAFLNLAAGFTSYPFLVDGPCRFVEVDLPHVIAYKRERIERWRREGKLPAREVVFLAGDLNDDASLDAIEPGIAEATGGRTSFALLEGITYYLGRDALSPLFARLARLQPPGSILAFDFWTPAFATYPVTERFRAFFASRFGHGDTAYNLLDEPRVRSIPGYRVIELTDVREQERVYVGTSLLADREAVLPEHYVVLERT